MSGLYDGWLADQVVRLADWLYNHAPPVVALPAMVLLTALAFVVLIAEFVFWALFVPRSCK